MRRAEADIDRNVENLSAGCVNQLSLRRSELIVQTAQHALSGSTVVVLHELGRNTRSRERLRAESLGKESAIVAKYFRLENEHTGKGSAADVHGLLVEKRGQILAIAARAQFFREG